MPTAQWGLGHPDTLVQGEIRRPRPFLRQGAGRRDQDADLGIARPHVLLEFRDPLHAPILGAFGFPQDGAGRLAGTGDDVLEHIPAPLTLLDLLDRIEGEGRGGYFPRWRVPGPHLGAAASPVPSSASPPPAARPRCVEFLLQLRLLELCLFLFHRTHRRLALRDSGIHLLLHLQRQGVLFVLELFPLPAQLQLLIPQRRQLAVLALERLRKILPLRRHRLLHLLELRRLGFRRQRLDLRQRPCMRRRLIRDELLEVRRLGLRRPRSLPRHLLGKLLNRRPLRLPQRRDGAGAFVRELIQRLLGKPLIERKLGRALRTRHRRAMPEQQPGPLQESWAFGS